MGNKLSHSKHKLDRGHQVPTPSINHEPERCYTSNFDHNELRLLKTMFKDLEQDDKTLDKTTFLKLFSCTGLLGERLFDQFDTSHDGAIDFAEFIKGISLYVKGDRYQRTVMLFHMFDLSGDGYISRSELSLMLHALIDADALEEVLDREEHLGRAPYRSSERVEKLKRMYSRDHCQSTALTAPTAQASYDPEVSGGQRPHEGSTTSSHGRFISNTLRRIDENMNRPRPTIPHESQHNERAEPGQHQNETTHPSQASDANPRCRCMHSEAILESPIEGSQFAHRHSLHEPPSQGIEPARSPAGGQVSQDTTATVPPRMPPHSSLYAEGLTLIVNDTPSSINPYSRTVATGGGSDEQGREVTTPSTCPRCAHHSSEIEIQLIDNDSDSDNNTTPTIPDAYGHQQIVAAGQADGLLSYNTDDDDGDGDDDDDDDDDSDEQKRIDQLLAQLHDPYQQHIHVVHEITIAAQIGVEVEKYIVDKIVSYAFDTFGKCSSNANHIQDGGQPDVIHSEPSPSGTGATTTPPHDSLTFEAFSRWVLLNPSVLDAIDEKLDRLTWLDPRTDEERCDLDFKSLNRQILPQSLCCRNCGFLCKHCPLCASELGLDPSKTFSVCSNTTTGVCGLWNTRNLLNYCLQCGHPMQSTVAYDDGNSIQNGASSFPMTPGDSHAGNPSTARLSIGSNTASTASRQDQHQLSAFKTIQLSEYDTSPVLRSASLTHMPFSRGESPHTMRPTRGAPAASQFILSRESSPPERYDEPQNAAARNGSRPHLQREAALNGTIVPPKALFHGHDADRQSPATVEAHNHGNHRQDGSHSDIASMGSPHPSSTSHPHTPVAHHYTSSYAFDHSNKYVHYEGKVYKRTRALVKHFKSQWAVCRGAFLYFFREREQVDPKTVIFLEGCFIQPCDEDQYASEHYYGVEILTKTHKYVVYVRNVDERKNWLRVLRQASKTQSVEDFYSFKKQIGKGKFAVVFDATSLVNGRSYAIKVVSKLILENPSQQQSLRAEMDILKLMSHPNIIHMKEMFEDPHNIYMVMPLVPHGDLFDRILKRTMFPEDSVREMVFRLLSALDYLHERGIVHGDIKPENILMGDSSDDTKVILADFGLSSFHLPKQCLQKQQGTISYLAPEVLLNQPYNNKVDIYGLGVCTYVLLCGELPFQGYNTDEVIHETLYGELVFASPVWKDISAEAQDLVRKMLSKDPTHRPTAAEALDHPFFEPIRRKDALRLARLQRYRSSHFRESTSHGHGSPIDSAGRRSSLGPIQPVTFMTPGGVGGHHNGPSQHSVQHNADSTSQSHSSHSRCTFAPDVDAQQYHQQQQQGLSPSSPPALQKIHSTPPLQPRQANGENVSPPLQKSNTPTTQSARNLGLHGGGDGGRGTQKHAK